MIDTISSNVKLDLQLEKTKQQLKDVTKKYKEVLGHIDYYQQQSLAALALSKTTRKAPAIVTSKNNAKDREATAISLLSDIHCEAVINKRTVNGLNEYNPKVAQKRVETYFHKICKLSEKERQDIRIDKLVLGFLGDMINNSLHDDDKLTNAMSPQEATLFCNELLSNGIDYLLAHGAFKQIDIVCSVGNHGRSTHKMPTGEAAYRTSYEYIIYKNLARQFSGEDRIRFHLPESYFSYLNVYGKRLRFSHGDSYKGNADNIGKHFEKANNVIKADYDFVGHWHFLHSAPTYTRNGCVIGVTPYVLQKGYGHQEPLQAFQLLDSKRGMTISAPIFLEG